MVKLWAPLILENETYSHLTLNYTTIPSADAQIYIVSFLRQRSYVCYVFEQCLAYLRYHNTNSYALWALLMFLDRNISRAVVSFRSKLKFQNHNSDRLFWSSSEQLHEPIHCHGT